MPARKRASGSTVEIRVDRFGWDAVRIATLQHSTLPWFGTSGRAINIEGAPLETAITAGSRDKLSLLGQFAAHVAFLRFAGVSVGSFDPAEWLVTRQRGSDARLIRMRAVTETEQGDMPIVTSIDAFAAYLGIGDSIQVLQQSWTKPEAVYAEVLERITSDARAHLGWLCRSAMGSITSPGPEVLRELLGNSATILYNDADFIGSVECLDAIAPADLPLLQLSGTSPLERFSAVAPLLSLVDADADQTLVDTLADRVARAICVVRDAERFDESSRRVTSELMRIAHGWSWAVPVFAADWLPDRSSAYDAPASAVFVVSPSVQLAESFDAALQELPTEERRSWLGRFTSAEVLVEFVRRGVLPVHVASFDGLGEPRRSYLGALAVLGETVPADLARQVLTEIGCSLDLSQLAIEPFTAFQQETFSFRSDSVRQRFISTVSPTSRVSLAALAARLAMQSGDTLRAAALFAQANDRAKALALLAMVDWTRFTSDEVLPILKPFEDVISDSPAISVVYASALRTTGRYVDAARYGAAAGDAGRVLLAESARRVGDYRRALELLQGDQSFDGRVLRGEVLRLSGEFESADGALAAAAKAARTAQERARVAYERAVLSHDRGIAAGPTESLDAIPYLAARWRAYAAMSDSKYKTAAAESATAEDLARTVPERIDAALDRVYASFIGGDWDTARHHARRALSLVEQTQGDRAAGGILFTLAYLSADSGYWREAEDAIERLERFYTRAGDERRRGELRMLRAHLAFCRGRFAEARRHLSGGADRAWSADIREAALLIADEIDWIEEKLGLVRTTGASACVELQRRHQLNLCRSGSASASTLDGFAGELFRFEAAKADPPQTADRSERLRLYRSLVGVIRRRPDDDLESLAREIAAQFHVDYTSPAAEEGLFACELQLLQLLAAGRFADLDLGEFQWRFVTRNRLGHWRQFGSLPPVPETELVRLDFDPPPNWIGCGDSAFVFVNGLDQFAPKSRDAVRALFALQFENFRLGRMAEQERLSVADRPASVAEGILGDSPGIRAALNKLDKVARRDVPVCILGESGTGKELFARAVHQKSQRRGSPFTAVNCAALPENLIESELFGHTRGAFTGADRDRPGLVETTDSGTLFLDEIGEMPLLAQAKLLRFLQEGEYRRVGDTQTRRADVRVIAATNRKLDAAVDEGKFREDLYYRIRGVDLVIPPLRERGSDILVLAQHFLAMEREKHRGGASRLSDEVEAVLLCYSWPGNVRELQNTIRSAHAIAADAAVIETEHLPDPLQQVLIVRTPRAGYHEELTRFRRSLIEKSLVEADGNQNQAARSLGMTRQALAYQIRELGILVKP